MGSMIHLAVGRLEIDWGKNSVFRDHSALFQGETDVANVPYYYVGEEDGTDFEGDTKWKPIVELEEGLSKPLSQVIDRLNLLGHTYKQCKREFAFLAAFIGFDMTRFCFGHMRDALAGVDLNTISANYGEGGEDFGKFFRRELAPRLGLDKRIEADLGKGGAISEAMENLSAYTILHLLARNSRACDLPVQWAFNDIEQGGYARREDFVRPLDPVDRFLIVTEGSSDAAILRHALKMLRPHVADFFDFVDMEEGYPFSGTGNLIYRKFNISFLRDFGNESATVNPTCDKPRGFGHPRFSFAPREGRLLDSGAGESRSRGGKSLGDEGSETAGQAGACSESVDISETEGATATPRPAS